MPNDFNASASYAENCLEGWLGSGAMQRMIRRSRLEKTRSLARFANLQMVRRSWQIAKVLTRCEAACPYDSLSSLLVDDVFVLRTSWPGRTLSTVFGTEAS